MNAIYEAFQKELGKRLAQAIASALLVLFSLAGFSLPSDRPSAQITLFCLAGLAALVLVSGLIFRHLSSRKKDSQSPLAIYSTLAAAKREETVLDLLPFHVLKYFNTFPIGMASVSAVANGCKISHKEALESVKTLWELNLIKTLRTAEGEWNGEYQITQRGSDYVRSHAT